MKLSEYRTKCQQDPEYAAASTKLALTLDIADRILDLRMERQWTQADLGARLDATEHFVAQLEAGLHSPSVLMLEKLAAVFGVGVRVELGYGAI